MWGVDPFVSYFYLRESLRGVFGDARAGRELERDCVEVLEGGGCVVFANSDALLAGTRRSIIIIRMSRTLRLRKVGGSVGTRGQLGGGCEGDRQDFGNTRFQPSVIFGSMLYFVLYRSTSMDFKLML